MINSVAEKLKQTQHEMKKERNVNKRKKREQMCNSSSNWSIIFIDCVTYDHGFIKNVSISWIINIMKSQLN